MSNDDVVDSFFNAVSNIGNQIANGVKNVVSSVSEANYVAEVQRALHDISPGGVSLPDGFLSKSTEYLKNLSEAGEGLNSEAAQAAKAAIDKLLENFGDTL